MNGFLIVDKPYLLSSFDVLRKLNQKFALKKRGIKFGHGGTLDPLATGVLIVALGKATRMLQFFLSDDKAYRATLRLGVQTSTDDLEGEVIKSAPFGHINEAMIRHALTDFLGKISQKPPRYSAVHINGCRAYQCARRGEDFEIPAKTVTIHAIRLAQFVPQTAQSLPLIQLDIDCSGGTYIRSIARDLGEKLGSAASLQALRRTKACNIPLQKAHSLQEILDTDDLNSLLLPPCEAFQDLPVLCIGEADMTRLFKGQPVRFPFPDGETRLYRVQKTDPGDIAAFVKYDKNERKLDITRISPNPC